MTFLEIFIYNVGAEKTVRSSVCDCLKLKHFGPHLFLSHALSYIDVMVSLVRFM